MTQNSVPADLAVRIARLESLLDDVLRIKSKVQPKLRDLYDTELQKATDGQVMVYRKSTGKWHPHSIIPPFNKNGALAVGISDPWPVPFSMRTRRLYLRLKVVGSTSTTARLLRNGVAVTGASVTIAASSFGNGANFDQVFAGPETDQMTLEITAAGAGAEGLVGVVT